MCIRDRLKPSHTVFQLIESEMAAAQSLLGGVLGVELLGVSDMFVSCFDLDDMLSLHEDGYSGSVAFVLTLAKGWRREDGGLLSMCSSTSQRHCQDMVPTFNRLVLFRTRGGPQIPHRVTAVRVPGGEHRKRFGVTGWYMDRADTLDPVFMRENAKMKSKY
eukprot:TRINITY_DN7694_c0_g1_i2.p1 TRINITY_DN7694_c0_g1~~TRINITY_DN7694_c0_g1_i2.p1  ORF type:complete len:161 (-),score=19.48 TRINITY_DN7694_c0_g1_i2:15-497(-)